MSEIIAESALRRLIAQRLTKGVRVGGPVRLASGKLQYSWLASGDQLAIDESARPANSIKQFFFPPHELVFKYRLAGKDVELVDLATARPEQIVFSARPCDSAGLPILDRLFDWDYRDEFYDRRRRITTVVTFGCAAHDDACFCTSVQSGPQDTAGSDAMLFPLGDGQYEVRCITDKGRELFRGATEQSAREAAAVAGPPVRIDTGKVASFLNGGFESPVWREETLACIGCAVCTYTCPVCHCFDLVDEGNAAGGARVKNWDSCQFAMFTAHASGHNPRANQAQRQRQRIYHKFHTYPRKFGYFLCTGCGNCARNCPQGLGVLPVLESIPDAR